MKNKNKYPRWYLPVKAATAFITLAAVTYIGIGAAQELVYFSGIRPVLLTGEQVDLRDATLSIDEYEKLKSRAPQTDILWSVPIGGDQFSCDAEHIIVNKLHDGDVENFRYFSNLKTINAEKCTDYALLQELEAALPQVQLDWRIHLDDQSYARDVGSIDLTRSAATYDVLATVMGYFYDGTNFELRDDTLTEQERLALREAFPQHTVNWGVELMGQRFASTETMLDFSDAEIDVDALVAAAPRFYDVQEIKLSGCTTEELLEIHKAYPNAQLHSNLTVRGVQFSTDAEEIDFSGIKMEDTQEIEQFLPLMNNLKKVIMSDCGIPDEQMDELNKRHENVQFVWTVYFSIYKLRTDAKAFCASNLPARGYVAIKMNNEQLEPIKYCTELIALDLGHMRYDDLSFLKDMKKLEYLILVEACYTDISVLGELTELKYLELFNNKLTDLSPLLNCKKLEHLNLGYTHGYDPAPLAEMTQLKRLWIPGRRFGSAQLKQIQTALPNTEVYAPRDDDDGSVGGKWREADIYFEMRNLLSMFYQPGSTDTDQN